MTFSVRRQRATARRSGSCAETVSESEGRKNGGVVEHHKQSNFPETLAEYLGHLTARQYSPATLKSYGGVLKKFFSFLAAQGRCRVQDVTARDIDQYRASLVTAEFSPHSTELHLRALRQFFTWLEDAGRLFVNPTAGLLVEKPDRPLQPTPTEAEIKRLLAQPNVATAVGLRDRALLETFYTCGLRREEIAALSVFDPDLRQGLLRVLGKGRKERVVPLGKQAVHWLKQYLEHGRPKLVHDHIDEEALWVGRDGKRISGAGIRVAVLRYAAAAGIETPVTPHGLRRACVTHMLRRGAHPVQLQMLLGHATMATLSQYLRVTITDLKAAHRRSKPGS